MFMSENECLANAKILYRARKLEKILMSYESQILRLIRRGEMPEP